MSKDMSKEFMGEICDEFKDYVLEMIKEGYHNAFPDHFKFMKACMKEFIDMKNDAAY